MKPRILVPNGDARQTALGRRLSALGRVDSVPDGGSYDGIVLPVPTRLIPGTDALPAAENRTELRLGPLIGPHTRVFGGGFREPLPPPLDRAVDLLADEKTAGANALLTAEAALMLPRAGRSLRGARAAVLGWGRIGRPLSGLLRAVGAAVTVAARREVVRAAAEAEGHAARPFADLRGPFDFVFNTIPAQTLSAAQLSGLGPDCLWIELASAPGGLPAPIPADLTCLPAGGLPGKYLPESAAAVLFEAILRHWEVEP